MQALEPPPLTHFVTLGSSCHLYDSVSESVKEES